MFYRGWMAVAGHAAKLGLKPASALATALAGQGTDRVLPVGSQLQQLLPDGLMRATTVAVRAAGSGATSPLLRLLAEPTRQGRWCALVGMPRLSLAAARSMGVALEHVMVVPQSAAEVATVAASLLDGFDIVAVTAAGGLAPSGVRMVCGVVAIREDWGPDWLDFYLPTGSLSRAEHRVKAFPLGDDGGPSSIQWRGPIDAWLADIAHHVYAAVDFRLGLIGFEVCGEMYAKDLDGDTAPPSAIGHLLGSRPTSSRLGPLREAERPGLIPDVGGLRYLPATR